MNKTDSLTEFARKGGNAYKAKYGIQGYSELGKRSAQSRKESKDPEYWKELSKKGVEARRRKMKERKKNVLDKTVDLLTGN